MLSALVEPPSALGALRGLLSLTARAIRARWAYRLSLLLALLVNAVGFSVFFLVWSSVYADMPAAASISQPRLFGYLAVTFILNFTLDFDLERRLGERSRQGLIASDLLRPIGFTPSQLAQSAADVVTNAVLALPLGVVAWWAIGDALMPRSASTLVLGLLSAGLALAVALGLRYLIAQLLFVIDSVHGVTFARMALHQIFSGLTAPLALFPPGLRAVAQLLPFRHVIETPASIWLGLVPEPAIPALLLAQLGWATLLLGGASLLCRSILQHLRIQGG